MSTNSDDEVFVGADHAPLNNNSNGIEKMKLVKENSKGCSLPSPCSPTGSDYGTSPPSSILQGARQQKGPRKKVSFASLPENRRFSNADDCLNMMKEGCELIKTKRTGKVYRRYYYMDQACMELKWLPTQKKMNKNKILMSHVKEVLKGEFEQDAEGELLEECAFTVVHGPQYETLSLVAKTAEVANVWVIGLSHLLQMVSKKGDQANISANEMRDEWLSEAYDEALPAGTESLSAEQASELVRRLNPTVANCHLELKIKELNSGRCLQEKGCLFKTDFLSLYKDVASRQEVYFLLARYSLGLGDVINAEGLQEFLMAEQGQEDVTLSYCSQLIHEFEPSMRGRDAGVMGIDGFQRFLLSKLHCDILDPSHMKVCQDMTLPLNHYYINSTHKREPQGDRASYADGYVYLSKDQLKGPSAIINYGKYLRAGVRYIEVDCWDGAQGKPIVYHGNTFTTMVDARGVIQEIADTAFVTSEYPVIVALANHCGLAQQELLAKDIEELWGPYLYTEPLQEDKLPSPADLKRKILIKSHRANPKQMVGRTDSAMSPVATMVQLVTTQMSDTISGYAPEESEDLEPSAQRRRSEAGPTKPQALARAFTDNVCIDACVFEGDTDLSPPATSLPPIRWELWSMSETVAINTIKSASDQLMWECKKSLMAVLPSSSRVDSSNYNPVDMWNHGVQVVAMNQQTQGQWMDVYRGFFQQNGACGYALKPAILTQPQSFFRLQSSKQTPGTCPSTLQIKVISGYQMPKPVNSTSKGSVTDPCVILKIFGVPNDSTMARTKTVPGNGLNPFFDEDFSFHTTYPDLAIVRFVVLDDEAMGDEFIGQYSIPYRAMKTGYRYINLLSRSGEPIPNCCLFVHIKITECTNKKPLKQGYSRLTVVKDSISLKEVHVKRWDTMFKVCIAPITALIELRYGVKSAFVKLVRACDLKDDAGLKQCLRIISNRVAASPSTVVKLVLKEKLPLIITEGLCPEMLKKAINAHQSWVNECSNLVENTDRQCSVLKASETQMAESRAKLESPEGAEEFANSPVPRKHAKVVEAVAYNMQVIADHIQQMTQLQAQCIQQLEEVERMFEPLGINIIK